VLTVTLTACWGRKGREIVSGADQLFERAQKSLNSGNYSNAITYYESLEARYPFSNQAKQAQLDLIYAYYMNAEPEATIDAAEQFERENPTHPRVEYAIYMRGLAQFQGQHGKIHKWMRVDLSERPPVKARDSFAAFFQLVYRFPDSRYAPDARQRMIFLRNRLANHENHVARYYYERGAYAAALNRAGYCMKTFDGAPAVADALLIMVESYRKLGMWDLAEDTERVLAKNFPDAGIPPPDQKPWYVFW
jgi:outer membrane protein assembly factor BamD